MVFYYNSTFMRNKFTLMALFILFAAVQAFAKPGELKLQSPDNQLSLSFYLEDGVPFYSLNRNGSPVVLPSRMGFTLEWRDDLAHGFNIVGSKTSSFDETWAPVWGEEATIRNHYNELEVTLEQPAGTVASADGSTDTKPTVMIVRFRLYNDGLGFRYEFPSKTLWSTSGSKRNSLSLR